MSHSVFTQNVYKIVEAIPQGKVMTYGDVAEKVGSPGAARAVGTAMKNNPDMSKIPCHRVVGSDGGMNGYAFGGQMAKIEKLKQEGVQFRGLKVNLKLSRQGINQK